MPGMRPPDLPALRRSAAGPPAGREGSVEAACGTRCSCEGAEAGDPPLRRSGGRAFTVFGLDCSEEVDALRRYVGPVAGGAERLDFDLLASQLFVDVPVEAVSDEAILGAIRRAGLSGVPAEAGELPQPGWWQRRGRLLTTVASGLLLLTGLLLHGASSGSLAAALGLAHGPTLPPAARLAYFLAVLAGAWFIVPRAIRAALAFRPDMNLLMTVAVTGAIFIGQWLEAAAVAFLFAISLLLESWSVGRARRAVQKLLELAPPVARILDPNDRSEGEVPPERVLPGQLVVVKPGERIPLDGTVVEGSSLVDASPVTGESKPVATEPGGTVYAGTIALDGSLILRVSRAASDTVLARIIRQVSEAGRRRAASEKWVDRFALVYTPAVFAAAALTAILPPLAGLGGWNTWIYRALVLLVIGCPCALVISTPVSVVAGLAAAARKGVLVKGGDLLEIPARLVTVALDKTGTLTTGRPTVDRVVPGPGHTEEEVLAVAAALELRSGHPLGNAIVRAATQYGADPPPAEAVSALPGRGIHGIVEGRPAWLGSRRLLAERGQDSPESHEIVATLARGGRTVVAVGRDDHVCGFISLADTPRPEAATAVAGLRRLGIRTVAMLTGDNPETARELADAIGITEVHAGLLPEDKVRHLEELRTRGPLAFVGDGINDAPALALADLGIAMGGNGTDVAIETSHVALMTDDLARIPWLIRHSRRTLAIIRANIVFALGVKAIFVILTFAGHASLWAAIAADTGASLLVIANGLRLLRGTKEPASRQLSTPETTE